MSKDPAMRHCDDFINDFQANRHLRWFLFINRLPAIERGLAEENGCKPELYATFEGKRVRVVMASRMGDVGITYDLRKENGYDAGRVMVSQLSNFSNERYEIPFG